jgi:hypothetical protein
MGAAPAAVPGAAAIPGAAAAAPRSIWGFLGLSPQGIQGCKANLQACRDHFCASQFGQMASSFVGGPLSGLTGGFIPSICPPAPSASQLQNLEQQAGPESAEAVAGKIKKSEADAKARVAAIEYLGTVDCNRWKEARTALINGLRADPSECVRYAAARVLNTGCCCSKPVIEALKVCVAGEDTDGSPPETSGRVKAAAFSALQNCLMRVPEDLPPELPPAPLRERERGGPAEPGPVPLPVSVANASQQPGPGDGTRLTSATEKVTPFVPSTERATRPKSFSQAVQDARRTLFEVSQNPKPASTLPPGKRTLVHAFLKAREDYARQQAQAAESESGEDQ